MRKKEILFLILTFLIFLNYPINTYANIDDKEIHKQAEIRKVSGLATDSDHLINTIQNELNADIYEEYGIYVTDSEKKTLEKLEQIDNFIPRLNEILGFETDNPNQLASFYVDFPKQKVYINFNQRNEKTLSMKDTVLKEFPYPNLVKFDFNSYSESDFETLKEEINNVIETYSSNLTNSKLSVNYKTNKINVEIYPYDQKLVNQLNKNFPGLVKVSEGNDFDEQSRTSLTNYMQGGLLISFNRQDSIDGKYNYCTLGFTAKKGNQEYLVTAGHCIIGAYNAGSSYYYQGGEIIGANSSYLLNQYNDSGLIQLTSSKYATNNIYKYSSRDSSYTSYSSSKYVGQRVCISGATSGFQCGEVEDINAQFDYYSDALGKWITVNRIDASYASAGGDSGAPVWYSGVLYGVHTNGGGAYNGIGTIVTNLGITPITN